MSDFPVLDLFLHDEKIGTISHLPGDKNLFSFNQEYIDNPERNTLSLSFVDKFGDLITDIKSTRTSLPPFFSNLLPEGAMRDYLATQANINPKREFYLLAVLGEDLPGALKIVPEKSYELKGGNLRKEDRKNQGAMLRFSLAGIQLKFSANWDDKHRLTIPVGGVGGSWIAKLPSALYHKVPENEYVMMELARRVGIDVPETALVPVEEIQGIPRGIDVIDSYAYIIKRFDRDSEGLGIHIEDFAQVFGVFSDKKYSSASYRNIAEVIWSEAGEEGIVEFMKRFIFNALIGNGDMHLKNWSLIYPDKRNAVLAPAYDFVSTIPYLPGDSLALTFVDSKAFTSLTIEQLKRFASKSRLPEALVLESAEQAVHAFKNVWKSINDFPLDANVIRVINEHHKKIPFYHEF